VETPRRRSYFFRQGSEVLVNGWELILKMTEA
jgi:hypothetical protein